MSKFVRIGRIVASFGLKGQVKVELLTDFPERLQKGARLRMKDEWVEVEAAQVHQGRLVLKLAGVNSIDEAKALQWTYLEAAEDERPELEEDEFLVTDLIGLKVVTKEGEELGEVDEVLAYPAQDILQVGEILIPMVSEFVRDIDFDKGQITVKLLEGMRPGETGVEVRE